MLNKVCVGNTIISLLNIDRYILFLVHLLLHSMFKSYFRWRINVCIMSCIVFKILCILIIIVKLSLDVQITNINVFIYRIKCTSLKTDKPTNSSNSWPSIKENKACVCMYVYIDIYLIFSHTKQLFSLLFSICIFNTNKVEMYLICIVSIQ